MARPKDLGLEHTWRLRLRRQATSGLSIGEFCRRERVSTASFYAWRRRLAAPPLTAPSDPPLFVPLQSRSHAARAGHLAGLTASRSSCPISPPPLRRRP